MPRGSCRDSIAAPGPREVGDGRPHRHHEPTDLYETLPCLTSRVRFLRPSGEVARYVELRRHTNADGDVLTLEAVRAATEIGARLRGGYNLLVSTGAQRATQTLACFLAARRAGPRWGRRRDRLALGERRSLARRVRAGRERALEALRSADPELVEEDPAALGAALGRVLDALADGGRALVVGHSPTNEAVVFGLTGEIVGPDLQGRGRPTRRRRSGLSGGDPGPCRHDRVSRTRNRACSLSPSSVMSRG